MRVTCTPPSRILLPCPGTGVPDSGTHSLDFNTSAEPLTRISAAWAGY